MLRFLYKTQLEIGMREKKGFTLIELLIGIVLLGILMAIAFPNYQQWVRKSRRSEGLGTLMQMQLAQERYRANSTTYGTLAQVWNGVAASDNGYYTLAITNNTATSYTLTATGVGGQASDAQGGTSCATLSITVNGTSTTKAPSACWDK